MKKNTNYIFSTNFSITSILLVLFTFVFYIITPIVVNAQYYDYTYDNSNYGYADTYNYGYDNYNYSYDNSNYGYADTYNYGYDNYNYGYDNSNYGYADTYNYGYDNYNYGYDNSNYGYADTHNYGYDNSNYDYADTYNYGYDNSNYNYGYDNLTYDYGYDDSNYTYGYDNSDYNYGYDNSNYGYEGYNYGYVDSTYNYGYYNTPTYTYSYDTTPYYTYSYTNIGYDSCNTCRPPTIPVKTKPNLTASCSVNPSVINVNGYLNWSVFASGGTGSYTYTWTGTNGLSGNSSSVSKSYSSTGTKIGTVIITSGDQSISKTCSAVVEQKIDNNLSVSCYASPSNSQIGDKVNWYVNVSGGDGNYSYDWEGTNGLSSSSRFPSMTYNTPGTKSATVTVRDQYGDRDSATCYANINSVLAFTQEYQPPMASAVYLSQVPYTGVADSMKLYFFFGVLSLFSAWIAYIIIEYKRGTGEFGY